MPFATDITGYGRKMGRDANLNSEGMAMSVIKLQGERMPEGTISFRTMEDDVPQEEKTRRLKHMDTLQERILTEKNNSLIGDRVQVLVEGRKRGKLHGRTRTDKLVYIEESNASIGSIQDVLIDKSSPWSLQGSQLGSTFKAEL